MCIRRPLAGQPRPRAAPRLLRAARTAPPPPPNNAAAHFQTAMGNMGRVESDADFEVFGFMVPS